MLLVQIGKRDKQQSCEEEEEADEDEVTEKEGNVENELLDAGPPSFDETAAASALGACAGAAPSVCPSMRSGAEVRQEASRAMEPSRVVNREADRIKLFAKG